MTPPPCDGERFDRCLGHPANRNEDRLRPYVASVRSLAKELDCACVDNHANMIAAAAGTWSSEFLSDGLHLSAAGHRFVHDAVLKALDDSGLGPAALPTHRPLGRARAWPQIFDDDGGKKVRRG